MLLSKKLEEVFDNYLVEVKEAYNTRDFNSQVDITCDITIETVTAFVIAIAEKKKQ